MRKIFKTVLCTMALALVVSACESEPKGLADAYKKHFKIGVAVNQTNVSDPAQIALIKENFNSITAENDMKPGPTEPQEGVFDFEKADKIANFCRENNIPLRGHTLIWHSQVGRWMFYDEEGNLVSKEVLFKRMENHITTIVNRYKDIIYCWDVVNEAITDDDNAENPYRQSLFYKIAGDEFIAKAFEYAHAADPNAILFYNDYNAANPGKAQRIYDMVKKMQDAGVPITGIGMQGHYNIYEPSMENIDAAITKYEELVDYIHFTEVDIRVNREMGGQLQFSREGAEITDEVKKAQADKYVALFEVLRNHSEKIDCVTFWNLSDKDSWLDARNYPLLIDENYQYKDAYYQVRDWKKNSKK